MQHFVPILPKADGSNARLSQIAKSNVGIGRLARLTLAGMSLLTTISEASAGKIRFGITTAEQRIFT